MKDQPITYRVYYSRVYYSVVAMAGSQSKKEIINHCIKLNRKNIPYTIERSGKESFTEVLTLKDLTNEN